jgi:6-phospho-beta-glucosidase
MVRLAELYGHYETAGAMERPVLTMHRGHQSHSDLASQVIAAMASGRRTRFVIQQRNGGAVPNLPADGAAQFPALVDANGWEPIPVPPLKPEVAPLIQQIKEAETLNVTAALEGDVSLAVQAAAANPLVPRRQVAETIVQELLKAHQQYLPQFR